MDVFFKLQTLLITFMSLVQYQEARAVNAPPWRASHRQMLLTCKEKARLTCENMIVEDNLHSFC